MTPFTIPAHEVGKVHVFAVNRPIPDMAQALKKLGQATLAADLLGEAVPDHGSEVFALSDIEDLRLPGYLSQGYAIPMAQMAQDRSKLEGLDGYILLLFSSAFDGRAVTLTPGADLTHIASYREITAAPAGPTPVSDAAKPYSGVSGATTPPAPPRRRAGSAVIFMFTAVVALALWLTLR